MQYLPPAAARSAASQAISGILVSRIRCCVQCGRGAASGVRDLANEHRLTVWSCDTGATVTGVNLPAWSSDRGCRTACLRPGGTPSASYRARERHPVVNDVENLDHAVRRHAVDDEMVRRRDAVVSRGKPSDRPQMRGPQPGDPRNLPGAGE